MTPVTWSLITGPAGMTINSTTGVLNWPTPTTAGSPHTITIQASNTTGFDNESWTLTVNRLNPVIEPIDNESYTCGSPYTGPTPTLTNGTCMLPIQWMLIEGAIGMTIDAATGVVSWPSPSVTESPFTITIRATNTVGFDDESWTLHVPRVAPVVNDIPNIGIPCSPYTAPTPSVTVPLCMNPITEWQLMEGPPGMTINSTTGVVSWPSPTIEGTPQTIIIRALNSTGFDTEGWRIQVESGSPIVAAIPNEVIDCGRAYAGPIPSLVNGLCTDPVIGRNSLKSETAGLIHWLRNSRH
jgi:hypothetical protein